MRVLKFGGTSVANAENLKLVSDIVIERYNEDKGVSVVVSAFSGMTDLLLKMVDLAQKKDPDYEVAFSTFTSKVYEVASALLPSAKVEEIRPELDENHKSLSQMLAGVALIQEASPKTKDFVASFGERNSAFVLSHYLQSIGLPALYLDARTVIKTNDSFGSALVNFKVTDKLINEAIEKTGHIYVITGFIGSDYETKVTTTLGRGGSDFSAAIFAAALNATELEIWTDVDGVLTSNPRQVGKAYSIPEMSYQEAAEMSHYGAKVLYAPTIRPVKDKNIPTRIKNTFNPNHPGTLIHQDGGNKHQLISGLSSIKGITLVALEGSGMQGIPGIAYRLFKCIAEGEINVIMITQASSEHSICIAIKEEDKTLAKRQIENEFELELKRKLIDPIKIKEQLCLLAIIGSNMKNSPGVAGKLFNTLGKNGINVEAIAQGSSELNITFAVSAADESKALNSIHDAFFLSEYKTVHLFIVGVGLIGSTLLGQIKSNYENILKESKIELVINGLSNSRKMVFSDEGIPLEEYKSVLSASEEGADIEIFIDKMIKANYPYAVFIDNTASKIIPDHYSRILENNIGISTPNKIALSSGLDKYRKLKALAGHKNIPLNFETNVGAGLPVISTLKSLTTTGDTIERIEAVLSGSVSYIFNTFTSEGSFIDIVKEAQAKGLTEPDPREDLSGADVKRKILILARESGFAVEENDINIKDLLSKECLNAASVEEFYAFLEKDNASFTKRVKDAEADNKKLRFIASYANGKGEISLQAVDHKNPFFSLSGTDNMIVIYSSRYNDTPLVIRGPGAGADVTAAGILAEVISMSSIL